jgi:glutaredoxin 3
VSEVVFSKSYCPYCNASKRTLRDLGAKFYALELDEIGSFLRPPHNLPECKGKGKGRILTSL